MIRRFSCCNGIKRKRPGNRCKNKYQSYGGPSHDCVNACLHKAFLIGNKNAQRIGGIQTSLTLIAACLTHFVLSMARCNNITKKTKQYNAQDHQFTSLSWANSWLSLQGCSDKFGASSGCLLSGTPSLAFPTSVKDKGPVQRREMGSLAPQQSSGLWLGKAMAHCSHHFPLLSLTPQQEREGERGRGRGRDIQGKFMVRESAQTTESEDS